MAERHPSYQHQLEARRLAAGRVAYAFLMEMGTGKSKTIVDEFCDLWEQGLIDRVLIVTLKGNYRNWEDIELPKHMQHEVFWDSYTWTNVNTHRERERQREFMGGASCLRILVVNSEAVSSAARAGRFAADFARGGRTYCVVDESTLLKNHETVICRRMTDIGRLCSYRRIATGWVTPKDPLDLWGQFQFLGGNLLGCQSYHHFRARYAVLVDAEIGGFQRRLRQDGTVVMEPRTVKKPVAWRGLEQLRDILQQHAYRRLKKDCLDLPPKIYIPPRHVELTPEQQTAYLDMQDLAVAKLGEESQVTAVMALTQLMRMHQILCGSVRDDDGVDHRLPSNRVGEMMTAIEESGWVKTIVWCNYRKDIEIVTEALRERCGWDSVVEYHGGTSDRDRAEAIRRFQEDDSRGNFFVGTPQSAGRGITLHAAQSVVYYSNGWNLEHRLQSEDRAHRIGLRHSVSYTDLMVPGSIDEQLIRTHRAKIDVATAIMGDGPMSWVISPILSR